MGSWMLQSTFFWVIYLWASPRDMAAMSLGGSPVMRLSTWLLIHLISSQTVGLWIQLRSSFSWKQQHLEVWFFAPVYNKKKKKRNCCVTYLYNATKFHITDGQLLMSFLGNNFLKHFLQVLAKFSLNQGSGSYQQMQELSHKMPENNCRICIKLLTCNCYSI